MAFPGPVSEEGSHESWKKFGMGHVLAFEIAGVPPQTSNLAVSPMSLQLLLAQVPLLEAPIRVVQLLMKELEMNNPANYPLLIRQTLLKLVFPVVCQNVGSPKLRGEMGQ